MMHGHRKSDGPIVPEKLPNKGCFRSAEVMEERGPTKGNSIEQNTPRTLSRAGVPSAFDRIREAVPSLERLHV